MNSSQRLMLGETCLDDYVSEPVEAQGARKEEINGLIKQLEENSWNTEELPLKLLKIQREKYPIINPEFLSMHNTINYKGLNIQVPKFSVYKKSISGFEDFQINMYCSDPKSFCGLYTYNCKVYFGFDYYDKSKLSIVFFEEHYFDKFLLKSLGLDNFKNKEGKYEIEISGELGKEWRKKIGKDNIWDRTNGIQLISRFYGVLPQETKEKIKEAKSIFDNELYLISETKPESWNVKKIKTDPLVVGIFEKDCYLIHHFNTTPIENYVRKEFTE